MSLFDSASKEIIELHVFFVEWYDQATAAATDFARFETVMGPGMQMILPSGVVFGRDAIVNHVCANCAAYDGDFTIEITDIRLGWESDNAILVHYIERQQRTGTKTARRATALFTASSSAPNGVEWRHLHETWLQAAEH